MNGYFNELDKQIITNKETWEGGPTFMNQHQHIPGYTGHIHNLESENYHGTTYAKLTAKSLKDRNNNEINNRIAYVSNYKEYISNSNNKQNGTKNNNENIKEEIFINKEPIDRLPVSGYMGFNPVYRNPLNMMKNKKNKEILNKEAKIFEENYKNIDIPVSGYMGYVPGKKSENIHGINNKKLLIKNKINLK